MQRIHFFLFLAVIVLVAGCADYPPIEQTETFNIDRSVQFSLSNLTPINKDTFVATGTIDTNAYVDSLSGSYLLKTAQVGRISLISSDPTFTLDQLGVIHILIGADTVAMDSLPQGTVDTNFTLTGIDITKYMRNTSFPATLACNLQSVPKTGVILNCGMTIIYTANVRP